MPTKVRATCHFGRYHDIEVEDDVTAVMEYEDGKSAVFITSTGEAPGTNRLEITASVDGWSSKTAKCNGFATKCRWANFPALQLPG